MAFCLTESQKRELAAFARLNELISSAKFITICVDGGYISIRGFFDKGRESVNIARSINQRSLVDALIGTRPSEVTIMAEAEVWHARGTVDFHNIEVAMRDALDNCKGISRDFGGMSVVDTEFTTMMIDGDRAIYGRRVVK